MYTHYILLMIIHLFISKYKNYSDRRNNTRNTRNISRNNTRNTDSDVNGQDFTDGYSRL